MSEPQTQQQEVTAQMPGLAAAGAMGYEQDMSPLSPHLDGAAQVGLGASQAASQAGSQAGSQANAQNGDGFAGETSGPAIDTPGAPGAVAAGFLKIKDVKTVSRAKTLRLQNDDIIVGVGGALLNGDIESFLDMLFECDPNSGVMLTIYRKGIIYNVIARGMLGCTLEYAKPDQAEAASKAFIEAKVGAPEEYIIYEVLRDIKRRCEVIDTKPSLLAVLFSLGWLVQTRLWEALIAVILIYVTTLAVHWSLFVLSVILLGLYFRRAQITIQRSFGLLRDRQMWMVIAARSLEEVQKTCRQFDPKCTFNPDLVGPPEIDEAPKKRRRRRGSASPA